MSCRRRAKDHRTTADAKAETKAITEKNSSDMSHPSVRLRRGSLGQIGKRDQCTTRNATAGESAVGSIVRLTTCWLELGRPSVFQHLLFDLQDSPGET